MLSTILGITNLACGLIMLLVAIPLSLRRVRPNIFYGVRLPESFRSERAWTDINRYGGTLLVIFSLILMAFGIVTFFMPLTSRWAVILTAVAPAAVLLPALQTWRFARHYARQDER